MLFATSTISASGTEYYLTDQALDLINYNYQFFLILFSVLVVFLIILVVLNIFD